MSIRKLIIFNKSYFLCFNRQKKTRVGRVIWSLLMINSIVINPPKKGVYVDVDTVNDTFLLDCGNLYLEFTRINQDTFQLKQAHSVNSLTPHPVVSWSGVLWTRQAALECHQSLTAYAQGLNQTP